MNKPFQDFRELVYTWREMCPCGCGGYTKVLGTIEGYMEWLNLQGKTGFGGILLRREPKTCFKNFTFRQN